MQRTLSDLSVLEYPSLDYNQKIRDLRRILLNEYDPESCVKSIIFVDLYGNTVEVGTAAWDVSGESFTAIKKQMEQGKGAYSMEILLQRKLQKNSEKKQMKSLSVIINRI